MTQVSQNSINVQFTLANGSFSDSGNNSANLTGLRVRAQIIVAGGNTQGQLDCRIYGMTLSMMNQLSTLGLLPQVIQKNTITVQAGTSQSGMGTVFVGNITQAYIDGSSPADLSFVVTAQSALYDATKNSPPSSYTGSADVATIMSSLATQMGVQFENNGVNVKLANQYLGGSYYAQAKKVVENAGIEWNAIDKGILSIWPAGQGRTGGTAIVLDPTQGQTIGYPGFTSYGIALRIKFNPSIEYGRQIQVQNSKVTGANGKWYIYKLSHNLESIQPKGAWNSDLLASTINASPGVA